MANVWEWGWRVCQDYGHITALTLYNINGKWRLLLRPYGERKTLSTPYLCFHGNVCITQSTGGLTEGGTLFLEWASAIPLLCGSSEG